MVDDDKHLARAVKRGLEAEGFAVDVAFDGIEGEWLATENPYDAMVLDVMLPGRNGYELCEHLREAGNWTPILMLTAKDGVDDEAQALDTGADDYLAKPFAYVVLVARLRALLRRGREPVLRCSRRATCASTRPRTRCDAATQSVELTPRQFSLLEFLMRRPGEVLSKRDDPRARVGLRLRGRPQHRRGLRPAAAKALDEPFGKHRPPDRSRGRLPARPGGG